MREYFHVLTNPNNTEKLFNWGNSNTLLGKIETVIRNETLGKQYLYRCGRKKLNTITLYRKE